MKNMPTCIRSVYKKIEYLKPKCTCMCPVHLKSTLDAGTESSSCIRSFVGTYYCDLATKIEPTNPIAKNTDPIL